MSCAGRVLCDQGVGDFDHRGDRAGGAHVEFGGRHIERGHVAQVDRGLLARERVPGHVVARGAPEDVVMAVPAVALTFSAGYPAEDLKLFDKHGVRVKSVVIAGIGSGVGKTLMTAGLIGALRRRGLTVQPFKCGPDYIDPPFHRAASGRPSVNLDSWAMSPELLGRLAIQVGIDCELIICEALMGLFDGVPGPAGRTGSSADVAAALGWPMLLVLDASGQSQSAAAIVKGCATYDRRVTIAGVVLNRIGSPRHAKLVTDAIEALGIPVGDSPTAAASTVTTRRHWYGNRKTLCGFSVIPTNMSV